MQHTPSDHRTTKTLKKKILKSKILEEIRIYLCIPIDVPSGGTEFVTKLKEIGTKRQQMAIDHIKPLYDQIFKGRLSIQKLHRWAMSNGKIHKRCLLQSEEIKQYALEEVKRLKEQGLTERMILTEIAKIVGKEASRSSLARWMRECLEFNFDQGTKRGTKRVKIDTLCQDGGQNEISTQQLSPNLENYSYSYWETQNSLESCFYDNETYFMEMDAWRSIGQLSISAESMAAIDNLYQKLNA